MFKKIVMSFIGLLAGPLIIILTLPLYNWSVMGGLFTAIVISVNTIIIVWKAPVSKESGQ